MIEPGDKLPEFALDNLDGDLVSNETLMGQRSVICFYPSAFSGVCTDQLSVYQEKYAEFEARGAKLYAISVDRHHAQRAFGEQLGLSDITMLSDFYPHGEVADRFGILRAEGISERAVFVVEPDGTVSWSIVMPSPGEFPAAQTILAGLDGAKSS